MIPYPPTPPCDYGFGTAYERQAIYQFLSDRLKLWGDDIKTGIEGFYDGLFGLPGLHLLPLAARGGHVTVACRSDADAQNIHGIYERLGLAGHLSLVRASEPSELAGQKFDLVFLFNALPYSADWRGFLASAASLSDRRMIVSAANRYSYGVTTRLALKKLTGSSEVELIDHPSTWPHLLRDELRRLGTVESEGFVDAPWWPDFCGKPGDSILSWMLGQIPMGGRIAARLNSGAKPNPFTFDAASFPYFQNNNPHLELLKNKMAVHPSFERAWPAPLKCFFAHHRIFVVQRELLA